MSTVGAKLRTSSWLAALGAEPRPGGTDFLRLNRRHPVPPLPSPRIWSSLSLLSHAIAGRTIAARPQKCSTLLLQTIMPFWLGQAIRAKQPCQVAVCVNGVLSSDKSASSVTVSQRADPLARTVTDVWRRMKRFTTVAAARWRLHWPSEPSKRKQVPRRTTSAARRSRHRTCTPAGLKGTRHSPFT